MFKVPKNRFPDTRPKFLKAQLETKIDFLHFVGGNMNKYLGNHLTGPKARSPVGSSGSIKEEAEEFLQESGGGVTFTRKGCDKFDRPLRGVYASGESEKGNLGFGKSGEEEGR